MAHLLKMENESENNERKRKLDSPTRKFNDEEVRCCEVIISNIPYEFHWQKLKDLIRDKVGEVGHVKIWQDESGKPKGAGVAVFASADLAQKAVDDLNKHEVNGRTLVVKKYTDDEKRKRQRLEEKKEASRWNQQGGGSHRPEVSERIGNRDKHMNEEDAAGRILEMVHTIQNSDPGVLRRLGVNENVIHAVQTGQLSDTVFVANVDFNMKWQDLKDIFKSAGRVNNVKMVEDSEGKSKGYGTVSFSSPIEALEAVAKFHGHTVRDRRMTVKMDQMSKNRISIANLMANYGQSRAPPMPPMAPQEMYPRSAGLGIGLNNPLSGLGSSSLLSRELELERLALQREREKILLSSLQSERSAFPIQSPSYGMGDLSRSLNLHKSLEDPIRDVPGFRSGIGNSGMPQLEREPSLDLRHKEMELLKELEMLRSRMGSSTGASGSLGTGHSGSFSAGNSGLQGLDSFNRDSLSMNSSNEPNPALAPGFGRVGGGGGANTTNCQVFIRNLPFQVNWQMLKDRFTEFGKVLYAEIKMDNGKSKGCGIVKFSAPQEAENAIMRMNGKIIDGREIEVRFDSSGH